MANGDAAAAAGMDTLTGNEDRRDGWDEINLTRDYIAERTSAVTPVAKGGTGATTAEAARVNLDAVGNDQVVVSTSGATIAGLIPRYDGTGRLAAGAPAAANHVANKSYVDGRPTGVPATGGTFTGNVFFPNSIAASSGYTVAYINGDGRPSRGASSERYKTDIEMIDPATLGAIFPDLYTFRMIGSDTPRFGWIAERLAEQPDLLPFVVYQRVTEYNADTDTRTTRIAVDEAGNPIPDSIDFIALLIAQNAQLNQEAQDLRGVVAGLCDRIAALEDAAS